MFAQPLRAIQEQCGYLPAEEIKDLSTELGVPLHSLHEFISFFPHFRLEPPPDVVVRVDPTPVIPVTTSVFCDRSPLSSSVFVPSVIPRRRLTDFN